MIDDCRTFPNKNTLTVPTLVHSTTFYILLTTLHKPIYLGCLLSPIIGSRVEGNCSYRCCCLRVSLLVASLLLRLHHDQEQQQPIINYRVVLETKTYMR